ncbi:hypothetical protein HY636_02490 [Candidatus Woesearchaeota archaeon]|nr:hypothetical protein [Candidatus Woesearchaeota archaeon]
MRKNIIYGIIVVLIVLFIATIRVFAQDAQSPSFETESTESDDAGVVTEFEEEEAVEEEIVEESAGMTPDSPFYFVDEIADKIEIATAEGEEKAEVAANIAAEKVAEAKLMSDKNLTSETLKALNNANVSSLVEGEVSPKLKEMTQEKMEFIKKLLAEMDKTIPEDLSAIQALIDAQQTQADKNKIAAELAEKIGDFCDKLAQEDYSLMEAEPRCDPEQAPEWLKELIETDLQKREQEATKDVLSMITQCIEDPRQCDCDSISVESHKQDCIEDSALAVRCEYEQDESACNELESKGDKFLEDIPEFMKDVVTERVDQLMEKKEKEMFKKFAPKECIEAGVTTRSECEEIMIDKYGPPPEECMENGNFIGEEQCKAIMEEKYGPPPSECMEGDRFIGEEACETALIASGEIPPECVEGGEFIGRDECQSKMEGKYGEAPEECMENGEFIGEEQCKSIMTEKFGEAPSECMQDGQFIGEEECKAVMIEKGISIGPGGEGSIEGGFGGEGGFGEMGIPQGEFPSECADLSPEECTEVMKGKFGEKFGETMQGIPEGMPQISGGLPEMPLSPEDLMKQIQTLPSDMKEKIEKFSEMEKLEFMKQYEPKQVGILTSDGMKFVSTQELNKIKEMAGQLKETEPEKFKELSNEIEKLEKLKEEGKPFEEFKGGFIDEREEQKQQGEKQEIAADEETETQEAEI